MNQGIFFRLDKSSRIAEGIIYFRYLPFVRKDPKGTESDYPIYLQITGSAINFYIQRRQQDPESPKCKKCSAFYQHTELFSLPLMMNLRSRDNLQKTMNEVYSGNIEFQKSEYDFPFSRYNKDSYSCCFPKFPVNKICKKNRKRGHNELGNAETSNDECLLSFKNLFLDFLFDLEHSTVFKNSPSYEQMEESLREDVFFTALSAKAEYYHLRNRFSNWIDNGKLFNEDFCYASGNIVNEYINALTSWLNHIRKEGAEDLFYKSKWFEEDIEEEYKSVIFARTTKKGFKLLRKVNAFNRRHNKCEPKRYDRYFELKKRIIKVKRASNKWFIHRYDWKNAVKCRIVDPNNFLPRLIMATASAWLAFVTTEEIWKVSIDASFYSSLWILFLMFPVVFFLFIEIRNIVLHKSFCQYFKRVIGILVLGYVISFTIGLFFSSNNSELMMERSGYLPILYAEKLRDYNEETGSAAFIKDSIDVLFEIDTIYFSDRSDSIPISDKVKKIVQYLEDGSHKINQSFLFDKLYILKPTSKCEVNIPIKYKIQFPFFLKIDKKCPWLLPDNIFPHLLFYKSFLALFFGIFLQLIFEDKPVTEPL